MYFWIYTIISDVFTIANVSVSSQCEFGGAASYGVNLIIVDLYLFSYFPLFRLQLVQSSNQVHSVRILALIHFWYQSFQYNMAA